MVEEVIRGELERLGGSDDVRRKHSLKKVAGFVAKKRRSPFKTFASVFFEEDLPTVKESLIKEVIIPTIKDFMADIFIGGIERTLYGGSSRRKSDRGYSNGLVRSSLDGYRDYTRNSVRRRSEEKERDERAEKFSFEDVVMRDRASAQDLLDTLKAAITKYGNVSVSELYDTLDVTENVNFTDNYYGWTDLSAAQIRRVRNGYWIDLPKPVSLK